MLLIGLIITTSLQARLRAVEIENEILTAKYVGKVVFHGPDSAFVQNSRFGTRSYRTDSANAQRIIDSSLTTIMNGIFFSTLEEPDKVKRAPLRSNRESHYQGYSTKPNDRWIVPQGYWPNSGDTILLVIDSIGQASVVAEIENSGYTFWNPYVNQNLYSWFYFNQYFEKVNYPRARERDYISAQDWAERANYKYGVPYYAFISYDNFELLISNRSSYGQENEFYNLNLIGHLLKDTAKISDEQLKNDIISVVKTVEKDKGIESKMFPFSPFDSVVKYEVNTSVPLYLEYKNKEEELNNPVVWCMKNHELLTSKLKNGQVMTSDYAAQLLSFVNQPMNFGWGYIAGANFITNIIVFYDNKKIVAYIFVDSMDIFSCYPENKRIKYGIVSFSDETNKKYSELNLSRKLKVKTATNSH